VGDRQAEGLAGRPETGSLGTLIEDERFVAEIYAETARIAPAKPWPLPGVSPHWVGGLLDGEGHFGVNKHIRTRNGRPQYMTRVQVGNTERSLVDPLMVFGGLLTVVEAGRWEKNAQRCFKWTIHARQAQDFLLAVLPYMRHPKKIAAAQTLLKIEFLRKRAGGNKPDDRRIVQQEHYYQVSMKLNARGPKSVPLESIVGITPTDRNCPGFSETENRLADILIRVLGYAEGREFRVPEAVIAKAKYNRTRPHRHSDMFQLEARP
jgi:hypothetical protein